MCVISASEERLHARRRAARRGSAFEAAWRREVAQVGLVGQAVGEVIEVDGGEEVVGAAGLGAVVRGQGLLLVLLVVVLLLLRLLLGEDRAWLRDCARVRGRARGSARGWRGLLLLRWLIPGGGQVRAGLEGGSAGNPTHGQRLPASPTHSLCLCPPLHTTHLCLEKSWGGPRGPSGTFAIRRCEPSGRWSGSPARALEAAVEAAAAKGAALEALVLRSRLPWSPVFWNLRTRSSGAVSSLLAVRVRRAGLPVEPLESSDALAPMWWADADMINTTQLQLSRCSAPALLSALHGQWALVLRASGLQASSLGSGPGYADMSLAAFGGEGGRGEGGKGRWGAVLPAASWRGRFRCRCVSTAKGRVVLQKGSASLVESVYHKVTRAIVELTATNTTPVTSAQGAL